MKEGAIMDFDKLNNEQISAVINSLVNFVIRVTSQNETKREAETAILPDIIHILLGYFL